MTTTKSAPSLYRGDYYTRQEYDQLIILIRDNKSYLFSWLGTILFSKKPSTIKREVKRISDTFFNATLNTSNIPLYKIMYDSPLGDVPLYLNHNELNIIAQWRFQINK